MYDIPSLSLVYRLMADSPVLGRGETVKVREEVEDVSSTIYCRVYYILLKLLTMVMMCKLIIV